MNMFKTLDAIFPTGEQRLFGEVVGVNIRVYLDGKLLDEIYWKRKAWYVNASVNAFHMHRGLVREFTNMNIPGLTSDDRRRAKRLVTLAVLNSYLVNDKDGTQYSKYDLCLEDARVFGERGHSAALWWYPVGPNYNELSQREITDYPLMGMSSLVDTTVVNYLMRKQISKR
jgi:hypothetical protein